MMSFGGRGVTPYPRYKPPSLWKRVKWWINDIPGRLENELIALANDLMEYVKKL